MIRVSLASLTTAFLLLSAAKPAHAACVGGAPNGSVEAGEDCDDDNSEPGDGCTIECQREFGWGCATTPRVTGKSVCVKQEEFACVNRAYQTKGNGSGKTQLIFINAQTGVGEAVGGLANYNYNAAAFNEADNYAYAVAGSDIVRIAADGEVKVAYAGVASGEYLGDIVNGVLYYAKANSTTWKTIDLRTGATATLTDFTSANCSIHDIAMSDTTGLFYGIKNSSPGQMTTVALDGTLNRFGPDHHVPKVAPDPPYENSGAWGAVYINYEGRFFAINNDSGRVYEFDPGTGNQIANPVDAEITGQNDGFSCNNASNPFMVCTTNASCSPVPGTSTPFCQLNPKDGGPPTCVECDSATNFGCLTNPVKKICDGRRTWPTCVECLDTGDCTPPLRCDPATGRCFSCSDGIQSGNETDVDCGGSCDPCLPTEGCNVHTDCTTGACSGAGGSCVTCVDEVSAGQDPGCSSSNPVCLGSGTGSANCNPCEDSDTSSGGKDYGCTDDTNNACLVSGTSSSCVDCTIHADCGGGTMRCNGSNACFDHCTDASTNFGETDLNCGGGACPKCANGKSCSGDGDCTSGVCSSGTCVPCVDDAGPSAKDKGCSDSAPVCLGSGASASCNPCEDSDTSSGGKDYGCTDNTNNACLVSGGSSSCVDCTIHADCGGGTQRCDTGDNDCFDHCTDASKDFGETDVDCGGSCRGVDTCAAGKGCAIHGDCDSSLCDTTPGSMFCANCLNSASGGQDSGCDSDDPVCVGTGASSACVACENNQGPGTTADFGCSAPNHVCDTSGTPTCVACLTDPDDCGGGTMRCDTSNKQCYDHCKDTTKNYGETDEDCGGTCRAAKTCDEGEGCAVNADCDSTLCDTTTGRLYCAHCLDDKVGSADSGCSGGTPVCYGLGASSTCVTCEDNVVTPSTTADHGCNASLPACDLSDPANPVCRDCLHHDHCGGGTQRCDLTSKACFDHCANDTTDFGETDEDCGGSCAPTHRCDPGKVCAADGDCDPAYCGTDKRCAACRDKGTGVTDDGCGGSAKVCVGTSDAAKCVVCEDNQPPGTTPDFGCGALSPACDVSGAAPVCVDCLHDAHCGGGTMRCDTDSETCYDHCADGIKSGSESDVDCGADCTRCAAGKSCTSPLDCVTNHCKGGKCTPKPDSDGDGVPDKNDNCDGDVNPDQQDSDGDLVGDACDNCPDANNTAQENSYGGTAGDACEDTDGDGVADVLDIDDDNDGILDSVEAPAGALVDTDGDGVPDLRDLDSDDDGIADLIESGLSRAQIVALDGDVDGVIDASLGFGPNGFGDGAETAPESGLPAYAVADTDSDGAADFRDLDADNDGLDDVVEGGRDINATDADGDGITDGGDDDGDGFADSVDSAPGRGAPASLPPDTDGDGLFDFRDLDSDGDELSDLIEGAVPPAADLDGDGLVDGPDADGDGISDPVDGQPATYGDGLSPALPDEDGDGKPDPYDIDDRDGDGIPDVDDIDDDNDGIPDVVEGDGAVDTDGDGVADSLDLDADGDGIYDLIESGLPPSEIAALDGDGDGVIDPTRPFGDNGLANDVETSADSGQTSYATADTDGDGVFDFRDLDADGDGLDDVVEGGRDIAAVDANGDGITDGADADGDGIADSADGVAGPGGAATQLPDRDLDDAPDFRDLDSDGDTIADAREAGLPADVDGDGDGKVDGGDGDGDGIADLVDGKPQAYGDAGGATLPDSDGDGVPDVHDRDDHDGDGVPDALDLDDDNDGIPDAREGDGDVDTDGDGVPDSRDLDSDNDGIPDLYEGGLTAKQIAALDADGDAVIDAEQPFGNNGLADGVETTADSGEIGYAISNVDGDGAADFRDLDADDDGLDDIVESGLALAAVDADSDGLVDGNDGDGDGVGDSADGKGGAGMAKVVVRDSDGDGVADFRSLDSDGDGVMDVAEAGPALASLDANADGMIDGDDGDNDGIKDGADGKPAVFGDAGPLGLPDSDGDGVPDPFDPDQPKPDTDTDGDGVPDSEDLDDDNDGIPDAVEGEGTDSDGDGVPDSKDLDSDNDGILDLYESGADVSELDKDGDGVIDGPYGKNGLADAVESEPDSGKLGYEVIDSDGDGKEDFRDVDSDDDGLTDLVEGGVDPALDGDGDGVVDGDADGDGDGIVDAADATPQGFGSTSSGEPFPDKDKNGVPDYREPHGGTDAGPSPTPGGIGDAKVLGTGCIGSVAGAGRSDAGLPITLLMLALALGLGRRRRR